MGKALDGYEGVNLIFNNNDGKQFDGPVVTLNRNFYFRITDKGFEEIDPEASYCIYVDDQSNRTSKDYPNRTYQPHKPQSHHVLLLPY